MDLRTYYTRFMPIKEVAHMLSIAMPGRFAFREFSFGFQKEGAEVYVRWQSFADVHKFEEEVRRRGPSRIDVGPYYGAEPRLRYTEAEMLPLRREFVIDIDVDDYGVLRSCNCAAICTHCWPLVAVAAQTVDFLLRRKFGLTDLQWFFSGRRGVHCWCLDTEAAVFTDTFRQAICDYFNVWSARSAWSSAAEMLAIKPEALQEFRPLVERILRPRFERLVAKGVIDLGEPSLRSALLTLCKPRENATLARAALSALTLPDNAHRWAGLKSALVTHHLSGSALLQTIVMGLAFPRLDYNVSRRRQHLLRCPFSVHSSTGNVCVPLAVRTMAAFDPGRAPNVFSGANFDSMPAYVQMLQTFLLRDAEVSKRLVCMHCVNRQVSLEHLPNAILFVSDADWQLHMRAQHPLSEYSLANSRLVDLVEELATDTETQEVDATQVQAFYWQLERKFGMLV